MKVDDAVRSRSEVRRQISSGGGGVGGDGAVALGGGFLVLGDGRVTAFLAARARGVGVLCALPFVEGADVSLGRFALGLGDRRG